MLGVKRQFVAVGIPAEVHYETNWPAFSQRLTEGRFSMFVYAWHADVPDPDNFLFKLFHSQSLRNLTGYANPIVDDLLFQARRERRSRAPDRDLSARGTNHRGRGPRRPGVALHVRAALPVLRAECGSEWPRRRVLAPAQAVARASATMMGWRGIPTVEIRSLQTKFLIGTLLVLVLIMTGFITVVEQRQRSATVDEVQRRGEVLARSLAATSTGALLLYNFTALEQNVDQVAVEADVVYAIILDGDGKVVAHSRRPELVGLVLDGPVHERAAATSQLLVRGIGAAQDRRAHLRHRDAGARRGAEMGGRPHRPFPAAHGGPDPPDPLGARRAIPRDPRGRRSGSRVRRAAHRASRSTARGRRRGDLQGRARPADWPRGTGRDRPAAPTFNHMAAQLRHHQTEIDAAHAELRHRFEQLAEHDYTDSILGSVSSGIITLDLDGRVATMNPAAEMLSGLFAPAVTGRYCQEVFAHSPELSERLMDTLEQQSGTTYMSLTLQRPNGRTLPMQVFHPSQMDGRWRRLKRARGTSRFKTSRSLKRAHAQSVQGFLA